MSLLVLVINVSRKFQKYIFEFEKISVGSIIRSFLTLGNDTGPRKRHVVHIFRYRSYSMPAL
jgi:hypothetical protein